MGGEEHQEQEARSERMRAGARAQVTRLARSTVSGVRRLSSPALLAILSAGAFGAFLEPGEATAGAALLGAATAVGGNLLTDLVKAGIARLGEDSSGDGNGDESSRRMPEDDLEQRIQQILEGGGPEAERLRAEIAHVLHQIGAVGAALEAAIQAGDRDLQEHLTRGLAALGREFAEFSFTLTAIEDHLRVLRDGQDEQGAQLGLVVDLQYRQATDIRLLLQLVSELPWPQAAGATGGGRERWNDECPYRGLAPFAETDAEVFYGREVITAQLVTAVSRRLACPGLWW
ncbi:hypothetical protein [Nonomuraea sp. NPDC049607]|uniref:nSTAND1 domain-containing NTPase n=1 Tax=Nonomuraea sp. NPDC049607 TaxID=3154732 RepID=UPI00343000CE